MLVSGMAARATKASNKESETDSEEVQQDQKFKCTVVVHTDSRAEKSIDMGEVTADQLNTVNSIISAAFDQPVRNKQLFLVDTRSVGWHFNTDKVTCIEVRAG